MLYQLSYARPRAARKVRPPASTMRTTDGAPVVPTMVVWGARDALVPLGVTTLSAGSGTLTTPLLR